MNHAEIIILLHDLFSDLLKKQLPEFTAETTAKDVPGWDSLSYILFINAVELRLNIKFSFREVHGFKCIGDMALCILTHQQ